MQNVSVKLFRHFQYRLLGKSNAVNLNSDSLKLSNGLTVICPRNFVLGMVNNLTKSFDTKNPLLPDERLTFQTKYVSLRIDCEACPFAKYNLHRGQYHLHVLKRFTSGKQPIVKTLCQQLTTRIACSVPQVSK